MGGGMAKALHLYVSTNDGAAVRAAESVRTDGGMVICPWRAGSALLAERDADAWRNRRRVLLVGQGGGWPLSPSSVLPSVLRHNLGLVILQASPLPSRGR